jgi:hypothetical protein
VLLVFSVSNCQNQKSPGEKRTSWFTTEDTPEDSTKTIEEFTEYPLPSTFEVTKLLVEAGASYKSYLCNPAENINRYISLKSRALNLGVYGADLSYAATYGQVQETNKYMEICAELILDLNIEPVLTEEVWIRIEDNYDIIDSMVVIITDMIHKTYQYFALNQQDDMSILVVAGGWIEALYITTQICAISTDDSEFTDIITEQHSSLEKLLEIMDPIRDTDAGRDIFEDLSGLKEIYDSAGEAFTPEQMEELITKTEKLRNMITS